MKKIFVYLIFLAGVFVLLPLASCSNKAKGSSSEAGLSTEMESAAAEKALADFQIFDGFHPDLMAIAEVAEEYPEDEDNEEYKEGEGEEDFEDEEYEEDEDVEWEKDYKE
jgi:hypothetical protein